MKWLLILLLCLPVLLMAGALALNRVPLFDPPGPMVRLKAYLGTNVAETRADHAFTELRTPKLAMSMDAATIRVVAVMTSLGWHEVRAEGGVISAVVVSSLLGFKDDVAVRLESVEGGVLMHARSASRVGKGDFGANLRHLRDLFVAIHGD